MLLSLFFLALVTSIVSAQETAEETSLSIELGDTFLALTLIDAVGFMIGVIILILFMLSLSPFQGDLKTGFVFIVWGIFFQSLALTYTLVFIRLQLFPLPFEMNLSNAMVTISIMFFAFAVYSIRRVANELNKSPYDRLD